MTPTIYNAEVCAGIGLTAAGTYLRAGLPSVLIVAGILIITLAMFERLVGGR